MKYLKLKKQVFTESGIAAAVLGVLGGGVILLGSISGDYEGQNKKLQQQVTNTTNATNTLQEKYFKVQKNAPVYQEAIQKQNSGGLSISRQVLRDKFNQFNDRYYLSSLRLSLSGIEDQTDPKYKRVAYVMTGSDVTIDFEGTSDEYVFSLIDAMERDLPGASKITLLKLSREKPVTDEVLRTISQKGVFPLIGGEIQFRWYGIKPIDTDTTHAAPPAKK